LEQHLLPICADKLMSLWHRGKIQPGTDTKTAVTEELDRAQLILLLLSAEFMSVFLGEFAPLLRRALRGGQTRVVPILLRPASWIGSSLHGIQAIPRDLQPLVHDGQARDERFVAVASELRRLCGQLRSPDPLAASAVTAEYGEAIDVLRELGLAVDSGRTTAGSHPTHSTESSPVERLSQPSDSKPGAPSAPGLPNEEEIQVELDKEEVRGDTHSSKQGSSWAIG
jgi:hypothetical protein